MKYLFLLLISLPTYASWVNLQKCGVENVGTGVFSHREICEGDTGSKCVPYPGGFCEEFDVIDEEVNDKPIYGEKKNVVDCTTEEECEALRPNHCLEYLDHQFFYAMKANDGFEAYCAAITGYTKKKTGEKLLVSNPSKKAAKLAEIKAKKDQEEAEKENKRGKCQAFKTADIDKATTIAQLRGFVKLIQECQ